MGNLAVEMFASAVRERFDKYLGAVQNTLHAFARRQQAEVNNNVAELIRVSDDLQAILTEQYRPDWLRPIKQAATAYESLKDEHRASALLNTLAQHFSSIKPIALNKQTDPLVDFDQIYAELRADGKIEALFDRLISQICELIESNAVDSATAIVALQKMLDILRANKKASYVATAEAIRITKYLKNLIIVAAGRVPVVSVFIEALDRTVNEIDQEFNRLDDAIEAESRRVILDATPRLKQLHETAGDQLTLPRPEDHIGN